MAVSKNIENVILSLKAQIGTFSSGKPKYKSYSYTNIAVDATYEDVHFVATRLASLFESDIAKITRQDFVDLSAGA